MMEFFASVKLTSSFLAQLCPRLMQKKTSTCYLNELTNGGIKKKPLDDFAGGKITLDKTTRASRLLTKCEIHTCVGINDIVGHNNLQVKKTRVGLVGCGNC